MRERNVYLKALEISDPKARTAFLDQACKNDPELRDRVLALLIASERLGNFLEPDTETLEADGAGLKADGESRESGHESLPQSEAGNPYETRDWLGIHARESADSHTDAIDLSFLKPSADTRLLGMLGHYEIHEVLGHGAFGIVLGARDTKLERNVAIKALFPHLARTSPPRKRFLREARAGAAIRNGNVIQVFAVEEEPIPYIVMERVRGGTLQDWIDEEGPLEVERILPIAIQLVQALSAAHASGLIHRDVKPSNILVEQRGEIRVVLTDFGLARTMDDASLTQSGFVAGTPMYMSPEQAQGLAIDPRSDQFSLGSVLYLMLTGRPPFRASTTLGVMRRVAQAQPRAIAEIVPDAPQWFVEIIGRLMHPHKEQRYESLEPLVAELKRAHAAWIEHGDFRMPTPVPNQNLLPAGPLKGASREAGSILPSNPTRKMSPLGVVIGIAAAVVAIFGIGGGLMLTMWQSSELATETLEEQLSIAEDIAHELDQRARERPSTPEDQSSSALAQFAQHWPSDAPLPAIAPFDARKASEHQQKWSEYLNLPIEFTDPMGIAFRLIPPGVFQMGSTAKEVEASLKFIPWEDAFWAQVIRSEGPPHQVMITRPFYIATNEITHAQFENCMSMNPSRFKAEGEMQSIVQGKDTRNYPVEGLSWNQAVEFCRQLNLRWRLPNVGLETLRTADLDGWPGSYGLPTEAQWEYACRAGTTTSYWTGDNPQVAAEYGNMAGTVGHPVAVASYRANPFGLHDMHGNVEEHVYDAYLPELAHQDPSPLEVDPCGPAPDTAVFGTATPDTTVFRIHRGGDSHWSSAFARSGSRWARPADNQPEYPTGLRPTLSTQAVKRLLNERENPSITDFTEVHGADRTTFDAWLASLPPKYIPSSINLRHGIAQARFDAVAIPRGTSGAWQVNYFANAAQANEDFEAMRSTHANRWRMHMPFEGDENEAPPGLVLWVEQDQAWETWNGEASQLFEELRQPTADGWVPTSIDAMKTGSVEILGYSRSYQPGVGNHVWPRLSIAEYQSRVNEYQTRGWRPFLMQFHIGNDEPILAAGFRENTAGWKWDVSFDLTELGYQLQLIERRRAGFYPMSVGSYMLDGEVRYLAVWLEADLQ